MVTPWPVPKRWRLAAWLCLILTLATGTLLRYQWTGRGPPLFNSQYLLHAHSHIALLGWAFLGVFGLVFRPPEGQMPEGRGRRQDQAPPGRARALAEAGFLVLILFMTLAFLLEGYAFWSILLSTLHILISFVLIGVYLRKFRGGVDPRGRPWIDLSMLWFVVATLGPLLLAGGGRMGQGWIEAWVGYYLILLFNGWLTFAVIGLLAGHGLLKIGPTVRDLMALGVLPMAVPPLMAWVEIPMGLWVGWLGSLVFGGGLLVVGWRLVQQMGSGREWTMDRVLLASVAAALLLVGGFTMVGTAPAMVESVAGAPMLVIGFIHLQLLGLVSAALILFLFPARPLAKAIFLAGGWIMILILLGAGGMQLVGRPLYLPLQGVLTLTGAVALAGALCLPLGRRG